MLFHTLEFATFFLLFLGCYLPTRKTHWGVAVIVAFSSVFYGSWNWRFLPLLWVTIVVDYTIGNYLGKTENDRSRKLLLWGSIVCNLTILGYFKYWNFLVQSVLGDSSWARRLELADIVLPLGISFYVFQSMSYIIDVYRRIQTPLKSVIDFAAFVTFFPHLIAGPIQRIQQLVPQILNPDRITPNRVASGMFVFCTGFFRKSLGDTLAAFHDPIFQNLSSSNPADVVFAVVSFGLQIYLDFSGYSEMAVGIARTLGIDLIINFDAPYLSTSIRDFWRRWHISLSLWLRDYLYISLGGSRSGWLRQILNLLITMTICGLWHGAGWNFAIWGLLHGIYLAINVVFTKFIAPAKPTSLPVTRILQFLSFIVTFTAANYAWIYFRLPTLELSLTANRKIWSWMLSLQLPSVPPGILLIVFWVIILDLLTRFRGELFPVHKLITGREAWVYGTSAALLFVVGIIMSVGQPTMQFIYFQF